MREAIHEELIRYCEPYSAPEFWARSGLPVECFRSPRYGMRVVERLAWEFTQSDLIASGIAELVANRFGISSTLADPGGVFVVLRKSNDTPPFAVLTTNGMLGADSSPFASSVKVVRDHELNDQSDRRIFIVFSIDDLIALRSIGLVSVMAAGIRECKDEQLQELCTQCDWLKPGVADLLAPDPAEPHQHEEAGQTTDASPVTSESQGQEQRASSLDLVFVNWSPSTMTVHTPPALLPIANFLSRVERCLGCNLSNVSVWRPSLQSMDEIQFILEFGDRESKCRIIRDSVSESALTLDGFAHRLFLGETSKDLSWTATEVFRSLRATNQGRQHLLRSQAAFDAMGDMLQRECVTPLIDEAMACDDAVNRNRLMALANLSGMMHHLAPLVHKALARGMTDGIDAQGREGIRTLLATVDRFRAVSKEIQRW